jgi:three-Cys-motif partner protein
VSGKYRETFFDDVKEHSQIKLQAFSRYLTPWAAKVGSRAQRVWIVDGFAGAGTYKSGDLGSSGLALDFAAASAGRSYAVGVYFCENDASTFRSLRTLRNKHPGVQGDVYRANFWTQIDNVLSFCGDEPVFLFIDPFGLADLDFDALVRLCAGLTRVDLMVNFTSPAATRLAPMQSELVDRAVGGTGWTKENLTDVFCDRLATRGRFLKPARLPVENSLGALKYELVMASRHHAAYQLWNEEIAREDARLLNSNDPLIETRLREVRTVLVAEGKKRRAFGRDALIRDLSVSDCGDFHSRMYRRGVDSLLRDSTWRRDQGPVGSALIHTE